MSARVAGIVLAAGAGSRFGAPKALAVLGGRTLLARAVGALADGGCEPVLVVVGAESSAVGTAAAAAGALAVVCADWATGMGASLRAGLLAIPGDCAAAVVLLVDQPLVGAEPVRRVVGAFRVGAVVARAAYAGAPGHPVLFGRAVLADVAAAVEGDAGARHWLAGHADLVTDVDCTGAGDARDVDTPADLAAAAAEATAGGSLES